MNKFTSRVLALALALTLVLSLNTAAFASTEATKAGTHTATGAGTAQYINTTIYSVVLPTDAAFNFILDPLGLTDENASGATLDSLVKGKVIGSVAPFINNSSVPVLVTTELTAYATNAYATNTGTSTTAATFVDGTSALTNTTGVGGRTVLLCVVPAASKIVNASTAFTAATKAYIVTSAGTELKFALPAAEYKVKGASGNYQLVRTDDTGHGNALKITGMVNPDADWSPLTDNDVYGTLGSTSLGVKFTIANDTANAAGYTATGSYTGGVYGLLATQAAAAGSKSVIDTAALGGAGNTVKSVSAEVPTKNNAGHLTTVITPKGFAFPSATFSDYKSFVATASSNNSVVTLTSGAVTLSKDPTTGALSVTLASGGWHSTSSTNKGWKKLVISWDAGGTTHTVTLTKDSGTAASVNKAEYSAS